jgi:hypothetical protein
MDILMKKNAMRRKRSTELSHIKVQFKIKQRSSGVYLKEVQPTLREK